jgi:hypothetical protein
VATLARGRVNTLGTPGEHGLVRRWGAPNTEASWRTGMENAKMCVDEERVKGKGRSKSTNKREFGFV